MHLVFPQMSSADLLAYLADELDGAGDAAATPDVQTSVRRIERFLAANVARGRHAVVAIDEAQLIDDAQTLEALRLLLNFEPNGAARADAPAGRPAFDPADRRTACRNGKSGWA